MKKIYDKFIVFALIAITLLGCKTTKDTQSLSDNTEVIKTSTAMDVNLNPPICSGQNTEIYNKKYNKLQLEEHKFKDNAPFIEILENGTKERLWFSSSRADKYYDKREATNLNQQLYFSERKIEAGLAPNEGWGEIKLFEVESDNAFFDKFYEQFDSLTKGTITIANDLLIFSCGHIQNNFRSDFRNLWQVQRVNGKYINPKPLMKLSNDNTWESQPTLSLNGKHLFYISSRMVNANNEVFSGVPSNRYNLFYSYNSNGEWSEPKYVSELNNIENVLTPHIKYDGKKLYFSAKNMNNFDLYEIDLELDDVNGGYQFDMSSYKLFKDKVIDILKEDPKEIQVNDTDNQQYPFFYFNPVNKKAPRAIYWASDAVTGYGGYDLYACTIPYVVKYNVDIVDLYSMTGMNSIRNPIIEITGYDSKSVEAEKLSADFYAGLKYKIKGGSTASPEKGTYFCDADNKYIFVGYSKVDGSNPLNKFIHNKFIQGPEILSELCSDDLFRSFYCTSDTVVNDTIFITKAWRKKPFCPGKLTIEPRYKSIAYFQTGFWEVNTTANLKRDLIKLHEGFEVMPDGDIYNPKTEIKCKLSDYKAFNWEAPLYAINLKDDHTYSIANARWIELHPNNLYWGDRPGFDSSREKRLEGRKNRIEEYIAFAQKVDENLSNLVDTIQDKYIDMLLLHKEHKPQLLIEIFAVSDDREVLRGWYIGDTVAYRGSDYDEKQKKFITEEVKIIPPQVNEKTKVIENIIPCSIELNEFGNNGSKLGLNQEKTNQNTNLSRLRAWYGYKEVYNNLLKSEKFQFYLKNGKVALPDNDLPYEKAEIIIITRGKREDGNIQNPTKAYPSANNPSGNGYFDYDKIRRIDIQTRLLFNEEAEIEKDYCCDPCEE